ncbi:uncharacterized protein LOC105217392 isoform X1 [Zeugodacus cucurbitae]|nr:uncharacterized protein LOC105217392 isoform X1 [Zeugodacus cucurbitae]XP_054089059.1 uncharacterized protein LOC105217392 isoform X1 [Zeugodacus cucurbitae]
MVDTNNKATLATTTTATTTETTTTTTANVKQQRQTVGVAATSSTQQKQQKPQQKQEKFEQQQNIATKKSNKGKNQKKNDKLSNERIDDNCNNNNNNTSNLNNNNNTKQEQHNINAGVDEKQLTNNNNTLTTKSTKTVSKTTTTNSPNISAANADSKQSALEIDKCNSAVDKENTNTDNAYENTVKERQLPSKVTTNGKNNNNNNNSGNSGNNRCNNNKNAKTLSAKQKPQADDKQSAVSQNSRTNNNKSQNGKVFTNSKNNNKSNWKRVEKRNSIIFSTNHHYSNYNSNDNSSNNNNNNNTIKPNNKYHISNSNTPSIVTDEDDDYRDITDTESVRSNDWPRKYSRPYQQQQQKQKHQQNAKKLSASDLLTAALMVPCEKCNKVKVPVPPQGANSNVSTYSSSSRQYRKSKSYMGEETGGGSGRNSVASIENWRNPGNGKSSRYQRSMSDRRSSFDRMFAERNKDFVPIVQPTRPMLASSNIECVLTDTEKLVLIERLGKGRQTYPLMQCGTLDAHSETSYHYQQRSNRMDVYQIDDGFHSDGGTETPPPSPSSGSSIASASDHGSLESVDTGGTQRLAVLSFEQVRKLHDVMDEKVAIHGRGNFPTLEVPLKDLVNMVRRKLEADVSVGGAGVIVKDVRLNGGAASHVLASEDQPYNDLDLIYAIELTSTRHFDRVKSAVLNTLLDLLPEGVCKRRIMPCALKEAYVGKMVKVNNNNDGDRWSLISLGNSPGHKNVELKFVDTMRRQFEFSVDSFQIVLDSLLLFYDCAALPISENFYPTVVGESVYGDFQEALYHLQKKLISTRQPEEIRGGGLLKYCNLLVRNYKPVDPQHIKTLERYMCSRFFIDFPDINTQTKKLEAYLSNHFWGVDEEPLQYQYLMHLREVVEMSTVCLMGHERRQTMLLIQNLATNVLYKEQKKQQQAQEQYQQQQQQQHHLHHHHQHQQQQQQQPVDVLNTQQQQQQQSHQQQVTLVTAQQQQQLQAPQTQTIYLQAAPATTPQTTTATICCTTATGEQQQQQVQVQQQPQQVQAIQTHATVAQPTTTILVYNGVYYAPVIPAICTCNSTWLST